jgi:hypothetical protein
MRVTNKIVSEKGLTERINYMSKINTLWQDRQNTGIHHIFCDSSRFGEEGQTPRSSGATLVYPGGQIAKDRIEDMMWYKPNKTIAINLGKKTTAFDGEMLALMLASREALDLAG